MGSPGFWASRERLSASSLLAGGATFFGVSPLSGWSFTESTGFVPLLLLPGPVVSPRNFHTRTAAITIIARIAAVLIARLLSRGESFLSLAGSLGFPISSL